MKYFPLFLALVLATACSPKKDNSIQDFLRTATAAEKAIHEKVPIYDDYRSSQTESELRTYLLMKHLEVASQTQQGFIEDEQELQQWIEQGVMKNIDTSKENRGYFFYGVPTKYRYLSSSAANGLNTVAERFNASLEKWTGPMPNVRFAVSSAVRPQQYQNNLQGKNANAAFMSSHSSGISFDIFYDTFFVDIPVPQTKSTFMAEDLEALRVRTGYWLGGNLRRQLRSALVAALLELQREGKIYAIYEANQRTYHVTILPGQF